MESKKEFDYTVGIFDLICRTIRKKVQEGAKKNITYGVGVYTDEFCELELMTYPMKNVEERMKIVESIEGVNFVFKVNTNDQEQIDKLAKQAYLEYQTQKELERNSKKYKVGFVIGSFDLFHAGHLENLQLAKAQCDNLVVVLKSDERILKNKNKIPRQPFSERMEVLKCLKIVDKVFCMDLDTERRDIIEDILGEYPDIQTSDIVAIFGSDLEEKELPHKEDGWKNINVIFTYRDPVKMKTVSSSSYQEKCNKAGGIEVLEEKEARNIR